MKRIYSQVSPPVYASTHGNPKTKKQRQSTYSSAGSPPSSSSNTYNRAGSYASNAPTPLASSSLYTAGAGQPASSPPYYNVESPATHRSRSPVVVAGVEVGGARGKGRAAGSRDDTVPPEGLTGIVYVPEAEDGEGADGEDEELAYSEDEFGMNQKENARQKENLRVLLNHFDPDQMDRYEAYRRSGLNKASVRKLVNQILQQSVSPSILTVVRGFSKVFVGEIVEKARSISQNNARGDPLSPNDLREAYRLYQLDHEWSGTGGLSRKKLFTK